jgi:hypothetical protein
VSLVAGPAYPTIQLRGRTHANVYTRRCLDRSQGSPRVPRRFAERRRDHCPCAATSPLMSLIRHAIVLVRSVTSFVRSRSAVPGRVEILTRQRPGPVPQRLDPFPRHPGPFRRRPSRCPGRPYGGRRVSATVPAHDRSNRLFDRSFTECLCQARHLLPTTRQEFSAARYKLP